MHCKVILLNAGICDGSMQIWRESLHRCNRFHMPLEGRAIYNDRGEKHLLQSGGVYLLINSFARNFTLLPNDRYQHLYLDFQAFPPLAGADVIGLDLENDRVMVAFVSLLEVMMRDRAEGYARIGPDQAEIFYQLRRVLEAMLSHVLLRYRVKLLENAKVEEAVSYIEAHYAEPIGIEDMAARLHLDTKYLIRLFRKHMDMPPYRYLSQCRIEHALTELRNGRSIADVAFSCGYQSENAFRIAFKRVMGCTPKEVLTRGY